MEPLFFANSTILRLLLAITVCQRLDLNTTVVLPALELHIYMAATDMVACCCHH
ncbi:hypothetical protein K474DRAFT_1663572 [Panus rudis PR-1116 ss-1]|nr:hypothetical protein K474DRAFT_1663572 [Panus rudis PR-1116 ss-1]